MSVGVYCGIDAHHLCAARQCSCACHRTPSKRDEVAEIAMALRSLRGGSGDRRPLSPKDTGRDRALIVRLHELGLTVKAIAELGRVHSEHVSLRLREAGRVKSRPEIAAVVVVDELGRRVCPDCRELLVKKNPHGPGRYPRRCPDCTNGGTPT